LRFINVVRNTLNHFATETIHDSELSRALASVNGWLESLKQANC
jgi:hypothetical protein